MEYMKDVFKKAIMESVYPLLHSATLPPYKSGDFLIQMVGVLHTLKSEFSQVLIVFFKTIRLIFYEQQFLHFVITET